jgi:hypothetical protein
MKTNLFKHQNDEIVTDTDLLLQRYNFAFGMIKRNLNVISFHKTNLYFQTKSFFLKAYISMG